MRASTGAVDDYERVAAAIRFIDEHALDQPSLTQMAGATGLSEHHFHRLFRRWAGITPKRFLQALTLEHAKRRLAESRSVLEATYQTGLSGPGRLHDLFVTLEGVTPGEYGAGGAGVEIRWGVGPSPFGEALVARTARGICHLSFPGGEGEDGTGVGMEELTREWPGATLLRDDDGAAELLARIFDGDRAPLHLRGTNFQVRVWEALLRVPSGTVTAYEDVARSIGRPDAVRAVAGAVARNRIAWLIPCHRVIRKVGETGGYRWGVTRKRAMLAWETAREE